MRRFGKDVKYIGCGYFEYCAAMKESSDGEYVAYEDAEQAAAQAQRRVIAALYWRAGEAEYAAHVAKSRAWTAMAIAMRAKAEHIQWTANTLRHALEAALVTP
jgi:hypothetical protein